MTRTKKIVLGLVVALVAVQLIQPAHNNSKQVVPTDFAKVFTVPGNVQSILQKACYDCHSNHTVYPWYSNIQPMAWVLANHIKEGKDKLNFSEFGNYRTRRQASKLKDIAGQVKSNEMPIASYKMMHPNARLSEAEKRLIIVWVNNKADRLLSTD